MTPLESDPPPVGEEIHLPGPSIQPLLLAASITVALIGVTTTIWLVIPGVIVAVATIVRWVQFTRRDIDELPLEPH
jgi:hypothetical protein